MASVVTNNDASWTTPRTYVTGELITKTIMDTHVRDNLNALKTPTSSYSYIDEASNYTTTSSSYADVDSTDLSTGSRTWNGGLVLVGFCGAISHSTNGAQIYLDIAVDGVLVGLNDGTIVIDCPAATRTSNMSFSRLIAVSAGAHTITLQWKTSAATATLWAGAGTASYDTHPGWYAIEL